MKRTFFAAVLLVLLAAPSGYAAGPWHKTVATAQKAAAEKKATIFVDLWADWCGWCHKFEQEVVPSEAFQKATDKMVLLRLNTDDGKEGTQFAQRYQATRLPMFLLLNSDLTIVGVIKGYAPAADFSRMIDQTVGNYNNFQALLKKEPTLTTDYPNRLLIARQFRERQNYAQSEVRLQKLTTEKGVPAAVRDEAFFELAMLQYEQNRFAEVMNIIANFKKVQKQGTYFEKAYLLVADVYIRQGNLKAARDEFRSFKTRFPKSPLMPTIDMILPQIEQQIPQR